MVLRSEGEGFHFEIEEYHSEIRHRMSTERFRKHRYFDSKDVDFSFELFYPIVVHDENKKASKYETNLIESKLIEVDSA